MLSNCWPKGLDQNIRAHLQQPRVLLGTGRIMAILRCSDLTTHEDEPFLILSNHFCFFIELAFQVL